MNCLIDNTSVIVARTVPVHERLAVLPRHFGRHMLIVEQTIYGFMRRLAPNYTGGYWHYVELSNGGFYMAPAQEEPFRIQVDGNGFDDTMSAPAAGITVCLFTLSHLSFRLEHESISTHFHTLRDFALTHAEASTILAAIA